MRARDLLPSGPFAVWGSLRRSFISCTNPFLIYIRGYLYLLSKMEVQGSSDKYAELADQHLREVSITNQLAMDASTSMTQLGTGEDRCLPSRELRVFVSSMMLHCIY